ncbi:MAG: GNAT family N-acetyltransferase [Bacteroidota bacterium]
MLETDFQIRKAQFSDASLLTSLGKQTQLETFMKDNKPEVMNAYLEATFAKEIIEKELLDSHSTYYISEYEGIPIGYFKMRFDNHKENELAGPKSTELQRIYITKDKKGMGFGKKQLIYSENIAKLLGYEIIWLGVWEKNLNAIGFYEKNGYVIFGSHPFLFGGELQNDYLMRKTL